MRNLFLLVFALVSLSSVQVAHADDWYVPGGITCPDGPRGRIVLRCTDARCVNFQFGELIKSKFTLLNQKEYTANELPKVIEKLKYSVDSKYSMFFQSTVHGFMHGIESSAIAPVGAFVGGIGALFGIVQDVFENGIGGLYKLASNGLKRHKISSAYATHETHAMNFQNYDKLTVAIRNL